MAADSDGSGEPYLSDVTTVVTCEGDYYDPNFHDKFKETLSKLERILCDNKPRKVKNSPCRTRRDSDEKCSGLLKVSKLEPWNSVRVTLTIPREAAARLRQLANEGSAQLRQLGILSVQVEGDQVISLRIASRFGNENETQEIVLNTSPPSASTSSMGGASTSSATLPPPSAPPPTNPPVQNIVAATSVNRFLQTTVPVDHTAAQSQSSVLPNGTASSLVESPNRIEFRSPNVVCPSDTQVPIKAATATGLTSTSTRPFPFASMQQAAIAIQNRTQQDYFANNRQPPPQPSPSQNLISGSASVVYTQQQQQQPQQPPPPPYPSNLNKLQIGGTNVAASGQNIAISSPLLVNLLQNEGSSSQQNVKSDKINKKVVNAPPPPGGGQPVANSSVVKSVSVINNNNGNRVPPLFQQQATKSSSNFDSQPSIVQNVQTSKSVPSSHLNKSSTKINNVQKTIVTTAPTAATPSNNRLQQTQQLRHLQQQLIQQQQQQRLLNQQQQQQKLLVAAAASNAQTTALRTVQNFRASIPAVAGASAAFNSTNNVGLINQQPPPYPGNRALVQSNINSRIPNQQQNRLYNTQYPAPPPPPQTTNVPEHILPFNDLPIAQPMPHLGHLDASLSNITPSLTDLSKTDLDSLLPTITELEGTDLIDDIAKDIVDDLVPDDVVPDSLPLTEPAIPEELKVTSKGKKRLFLINPYNGQLEPLSSESSSSESESEDSQKKDNILDVFSELNDNSNMYSDDELTTKKIFDESDSESRTSDSSNKMHRQKNYAKSKQRDSPNFIGKTPASAKPNEKIKLRLKLEKNEPVNPAAYKVDVSFVNRLETKKTNTLATPLSPVKVSSSSSSSSPSTSPITVTTSLNNSEEPRVPPLHISLRGRNSIVISNKSSKKHSTDSIVDDKQLKKSKIRSKDKDSIKLKSRLNKDNKLFDEFDNELKLKTSSASTDERELIYKREPGEILMPPLKVFDKTKSNKKTFITTIPSGKTSTENHNSESILSSAPSSPSIVANAVVNLNDIKNHKKSKIEFLNKIAFKTKLDKSNKIKNDVLTTATTHSLSGGVGIHENDSNKIASNLKRQHSAPTINNSSTSNESSAITMVNGVITSPDVKKRKLSDSLLEVSSIITQPSSGSITVMNNIGSTNIGTIPSSIQTSATAVTTDSLSSSSSANKLYSSKAIISVKGGGSIRREKDHTKDLMSSSASNSNGENKNIRSGISSKSKDLNRDKTYSKFVAEKRQQQESSSKRVLPSKTNKILSLALPTAGDVDMEAKFKQRLLEDIKPHGKIKEIAATAAVDNISIDHKKLVVNSKVILNRVDDAPLQNRMLMNKTEMKLPPAKVEQLKTSSSVDDRLEDNLRQLLEEEQNGGSSEAANRSDINLAQILTDTDLKSNQKEHESTKSSSIQIVNSGVGVVSGQTQSNRSPPLSNSTGQGEDSGIESMDALSEKSPNNQSSQSPHCHTEIISNLVDTLTGKGTKDLVDSIPAQNHLELDRLLKKPAPSGSATASELTELGDIEAELAKMEGYEHNSDDVVTNLVENELNSDSNLVDQLKSELETSFNIKDTEDTKSLPSEEDILAHIKSFTDIKSETFENEQKDLNENKNLENGIPDDDCCTISRSDEPSKSPLPSLPPPLLPVNDIKQDDTKKDKDDDVKHEDLSQTNRDSPIDFDPLPIRRTPPLYTYSNPEKQLARNETESPLVGLSDLDSEEGHSDINSEDLNDILMDGGGDLKVNDDSTNSSSKISSSLRGRKQLRRTQLNNDNICLDIKQKSLLEQLLIEIPPNNSEFLDKGSFSSGMSHSPAISDKSVKTTVRSTRASSKLNSPDLSATENTTTRHNLRTKHSPSVQLKTSESNSRANSPAVLSRASPKINQKNVKRKRRESESSTQSSQSTDDLQSSTRNSNKKLRKNDENTKTMTNKTVTRQNVKNISSATTSTSVVTSSSTTSAIVTTTSRKIEESSDSDEPLIEIAGKVRNKSSTVATRNQKILIATNAVSNKVNAIALTAGGGGGGGGGGGVGVTSKSESAIGIRRSVRHNVTSTTIPNTLKTRSKLSNVSGSTTANTGGNIGNGGLAVQQAAVVTTVINSVTSTTESITANADSTSSVINRRKTRSAVTESAMEKRTRRNSKDGK